MRREAGRLVRGCSPGPAAPKQGSALSLCRLHEARPAVLSPRTPARMSINVISHHPSTIPDQTPQPLPLRALGVPLPGTGLGPVEKVDLLSSLLGLEGAVEPIALAADSAAAPCGDREQVWRLTPVTGRNPGVPDTGMERCRGVPQPLPPRSS